MATEEHELLRSAVKEFSDKYILDNAIKIERDGISHDLIQSIAAQGFLGVTISQDLGGSHVERPGYLGILSEFASYSPSVATLVLITNSIAGRLIGEKNPEMTRKIASGEITAAVSLYPFTNGSLDSGSLKITGNKLGGNRRYVLNTSKNALLAVTDDGKLILAKDGLEYEEEEYHLAFRGLGYNKVSVNSSNFEVLSEDGRASLKRVIEGMDLEIAAIAGGITRAVLTKTIEYTKVRKTFGVPLKDYSPVANTLARLMSELRLVEIALDSSAAMTEADELKLKIHSLDLAKRATKSALQFHGGYGYIEDFGVENFYRDAVGLAIMFGGPEENIERLTKEIFGEKSGFV